MRRLCVPKCAWETSGFPCTELALFARSCVSGGKVMARKDFSTANGLALSSRCGDTPRETHSSE